MYRYRVIERWEDESRLALRCSTGYIHMTRALGALPAADAKLEGARPHLGFGVLQCPQSGSTFRVIFESIGNSEMPRAQHTTPNATQKPQGANFGVPRGADQAAECR